MYNRAVTCHNSARIPLPQDAWQLFSFENHEIIRLHLGPGDSIERHSNPWRIVFFVLSGSGMLDVEDQVLELSANMSVAVHAGEKRSWKNTGQEELNLLVIKSKEVE